MTYFKSKRRKPTLKPAPQQTDLQKALSGAMNQYYFRERIAQIEMQQRQRDQIAAIEKSRSPE